MTYGVQGVDLNTMMDANGWFQYTSNDCTRALDAWDATRNPNGNMPKVTKSDAAHNSMNMSRFLVIRRIILEDQQCKPEVCYSG